MRLIEIVKIICDLSNLMNKKKGKFGEYSIGRRRQL